MVKPPQAIIQPSTVHRNERTLPIEGDIVLRVGDAVSTETPIARVLLPSPPVNLPIAVMLDVRPKDLAAYVVKQVGDQVKAGDVIARRKATMFHGKRECTSPIDGTIEYVSYDSGQVTIRRPARPTVVWAEAVGKVKNIVPGLAVTIETNAALVQGVLAIGEEAYGQLKVLVDRPDQRIAADQIDRNCRGCVLVAGTIADDTVLTRARELGAKGLIIGGINAVGHEKWPALGKAFPLTVIVTEGFGAAGIFPATFDILRRHQDRQVWLRPFSAGRPEVVVLLPEGSAAEMPRPPQLATGVRVRVARSPSWGQSGRIVGLPAAPRQLESGVRAAVAEVELEGGRRVVVPLANLELLG